MEAIVKLTRPRIGGDWLICDQRRTINEFLPEQDVPASIRRAMAESNEFERHYHVMRADDRRFVFGRPAAPQSW